MFAKLKSVVLFIKFIAIQSFHKTSLLNVHIFTFKKPRHSFQTQDVRYVENAVLFISTTKTRVIFGNFYIRVMWSVTWSKLYVKAKGDVNINIPGKFHAILCDLVENIIDQSFFPPRVPTWSCVCFHNHFSLFVLSWVLKNSLNLAILSVAMETVQEPHLCLVEFNSGNLTWDY